MGNSTPVVNPCARVCSENCRSAFQCDCRKRLFILEIIFINAQPNVRKDKFPISFPMKLSLANLSLFRVFVNLMRVLIPTILSFSRRSLFVWLQFTVLGFCISPLSLCSCRTITFGIAFAAFYLICPSASADCTNQSSLSNCGCLLCWLPRRKPAHSSYYRNVDAF